MDKALLSLIESLSTDNIEEVQKFFKNHLSKKNYFLHFSTPKDTLIPIQSFVFDISILKNSEKCINFISNYKDEESHTNEQIEESDDEDDDPLKNAFVYNGESSENEEEENSNQNFDESNEISMLKTNEIIEIAEGNNEIIELFLILSNFDVNNNANTENIEYTSLVDWYSQSKFSIDEYPETIYDALYLAANTNNLSIVDYLLYQGVDATRISKFGTIIFNGAVFKKNYDLIELLYQYNVEQTSDEMGRFPLHMSVKLMDCEMTKYLLEIGGDPNVVNNKTFTPLHLAAKFGCSSIIDLLVDYGAFIDKNDRYGRTPLHIAALYGQLESCKALCENGVSMEAIDKHGLTPMNFATMRNKKKVMKYFESLGLNNTNNEKDYKNRPKRRPKKQQNHSNNSKNKEMIKIIHSLR